MTNQFLGATKMVLSPAAQAVLDATRFEVNAECHAPWIAAAALRAAADQVVPVDALYARSCCEFVGMLCREQFLAIADELERHA